MRAIVLCLMSACVSFVSGVSAQETGLTNPGFEMGDKTGWEAMGGEWTASEGFGNAQKGAYGVVREIPVGESGVWHVLSQAVPASAGQRYAGGVWIKATNIQDVESWFEMQFLDGNWKVLRQFQSSHIKADQPFKYAMIPVAEAPPGTEMVSVRGVVHVPKPPKEKTCVIALDEFQLGEIPGQ